MELSEEKANALKVTGNVAKDCLDTGVYSGMKVTPQLAAFVTLGLLVKDVIEDNEPSKNAAILQEIEELANKLDKIDRKMKENFDDLKAFVAQYTFYNDVPMVGAVLAYYAWGALLKPSEKRLEKFRKKYEAFPPLEYARRLNHQLTKGTTNPLKMLMTADLANGAKTFKTWQENYESVLIQLCLVESLACGWFNEKDWDDLNLLIKEWELFDARLKEWHDDYEAKNYHWPDTVRRIAEDVQEKYSKEDVHVKATKIQEQLKNILTKDMFYVIVFTSSGEEYHENRTNQVVISKKSGCTVFIYRSLKAHEVKSSELLRGLYCLYQYRDRTVTGLEINGHYWFTKEDMKQFGSRYYTGFPDCGLVLAVKASKNEVGVAWTGAEIHKKGCGDYGYGHVMQSDIWGKEHYTASFFFAGYQ